MGLFIIQCISDGLYYVGTHFFLDDDNNFSIKHVFSNYPTSAFLFTSKADAEGHAIEIGLYSEIPGGIEIVSI